MDTITVIFVIYCFVMITTYITTEHGVSHIGV